MAKRGSPSTSSSPERGRPRGAQGTAGVAETIPEDLRVSVTNAPGASAYPISGFTYLLVYKDQENAEKGKVLADFIWWALHEGSAMASELAYSPLPPEVLAKAEAKVRAMNSNGSPFVK